MKKSLLMNVFIFILGSFVFMLAKAQDDLVYVAVEPCRIVDTRNAGGAISANTFRNFRVSGTIGELAVQGGESDCLDPKATTGLKPSAISAYVLAVPASSSISGGVLTAYPSDQLPPPVGKGSTVNFAAGQIVGNTTNVTLCDPTGCPSDGEFAILARTTDEHVVIDVQGYYYPMTEGNDDVPRLPDVTNTSLGTRMIVGCIDYNNSVPVDQINSPACGGGFTWKRLANNYVEVTFNAPFGPFEPPPVVTATANILAGIYVTIGSRVQPSSSPFPSSNGFVARVIDTNSGGDGVTFIAPFSFIAIGSDGIVP